MAINFSMMGFADRLALRDDYQSLVPGEKTPPPEVAMDEKMPKNMQTSPITVTPEESIKFDPEGSDYNIDLSQTLNTMRGEGTKPYVAEMIPTTNKSMSGYLGPVKSKTGRTMTEFSMDLDVKQPDGSVKEMRVPSLVPGLNQSDVDLLAKDEELMEAPEEERIKFREENKDQFKKIFNTASTHAERRLAEGKSTYYQDDEPTSPLVNYEGKDVKINNNDFQSKLLPSVFKAEGGYSDDPTDTGNFIGGDTSSALVGTNHGISADVLSEYLKRPATAEDMKSLTKDKAKEIYEKVFYTDINIDKLPKDVQEIVFHGVVNSKKHAIKVVQKLLGLKEDGVVGPKTIEAMKNADFTKEEFKDALLDKYKTFKTWDKHGEGWTNRFEELAK